MQVMLPWEQSTSLGMWTDHVMDNYFYRVHESIKFMKFTLIIVLIITKFVDKIKRNAHQITIQ